MNPKTLATLEFDKILARLARHTTFSAGRALAPHPPALAPQPLVLSPSKDEPQDRVR